MSVKFARATFASEVTDLLSAKAPSRRPPLGTANKMSHEPGSQESNEKPRGLLRTTAVLAVALSALAGCSDARTTTATPNTRDATVTSEPAPPTTEPSQDDSVDEPINSADVLVQTTSVEAMDAMTLEEFAKLPYADRAAYPYLKSPNTPVADPSTEFNPAGVSYYWDMLELNSIGAANTTQGAKMISADLYYTTDQATGAISEGYQTAADAILRSGGAGVGMNGSTSYVDSGETQTGFDRDGNPIEYTNITMQRYDNKNVPVGPETTTQILQMTIKLQDGRTIVTYPGAYSIEGKQSPIEGGTY